jgi:hypothetical protein
MTGSGVPPKYNVGIVESALLEVIAELHPQHLTGRELALKIVSDERDGREVETAAQAIRNLREFGLLTDGDDETVQPTTAALRAYALLAA